MRSHITTITVQIQNNSVAPKHSLPHAALLYSTPHLPPRPAPGNHRSASCFFNFAFSGISYKLNHIVYVTFRGWLLSPDIIYLGFIHVVCINKNASYRDTNKTVVETQCPSTGSIGRRSPARSTAPRLPYNHHHPLHQPPFHSCH